MIKVRFHLGRGEHYKHWQIKQTDEPSFTKYINPEEYNLILVNCKLINNLNKSKSVNKAEVKDVCGWIECEQVLQHECGLPVDKLIRVWFNPIEDIHWRVGAIKPGDSNNIADNMTFARLYTIERRVYCEI